jgi:hypothetical protein
MGGSLADRFGEGWSTLVSVVELWAGGRGLVPRGSERRRLLAPTAFVALNAIAFCVVRPDVPDLWAARARASAAADGVGLTYWFSWFGGSTPGEYSVITPFMCALVGTELVAAAAAVLVSGMGTWLVRDTRRPTVAAWTVAISALVNLWCGRVPFLLGGAFAVASIVFVRRRRKAPAALLAVLSVLASPVSGAFLGMALSGVLVAPRVRAYRSTVLVTMASAVGSLILIALVFGTPGPEPFPPYLLVETGVAIALMLLLAPTRHLRVTLAVSAVAALVVFTVPNGLGANFARLTLFCLPAAAVALSRRPLPAVVALMSPILVFGGLTSVSAARSAAEPASHASYYTPLATELDGQPGLADHRLELVAAGRAAYTALVGHAILARGWETQSFLALDAQLASRSLDAAGYRAWLDDNAVAYVAVDTSRLRTPESRLIGSGNLSYLRLIWRQAGWRLYEVLQPTPIVSDPARIEAWSQATMRVQVPCSCSVLVRVRWSRFLAASPSLGAETPDDVEDSYRPGLAPHGSGWTVLTTNRPGTYVLHGLL